MIKYATINHPKANFKIADFSSSYENDQRFTSIVFNECLHYFLDLESTLNKAGSLLKKEGRVIISHPKGYTNVEMQRSKNRLLVANLLPGITSLSELATSAGLSVEQSPCIGQDMYLAVLKKL